MDHIALFFSMNSAGETNSTTLSTPSDFLVFSLLRMYPVVPGNARINVENEIVVGDHLFPKNVSFTFVILYCWKWLLLVNLITFLFILYGEEIRSHLYIQFYPELYMHFHHSIFYLVQNQGIVLVCQYRSHQTIIQYTTNQS